MSLELLLIIAFGGAFLVYFFGKISPKIRDGFAVFVSLLVVLIIISIYGKNIEYRFVNLYFDIYLINFVINFSPNIFL